MLEDQFETIDGLIADVQGRLDTCRQAEQLSRAAMTCGAIVLGLVMTLATSYRTPTIVLGALTAILGGVVWLGANRSTRLELQDELSALDARKAKLIDRVAAHNGWRDMTPTVH